MSTKIQLRRDTAQNWTTVNPTLSEGEVGIVIDTSPIKFKIGDGNTKWNSLGFNSSDADIKAHYINTTTATTIPNTYPIIFYRSNFVLSGFVNQILPDIGASSNSKVSMLFIECVGDIGDYIRFTKFGDQQIDGADSVDIRGGERALLIAGTGQWFYYPIFQHGLQGVKISNTDASQNNVGEIFFRDSTVIFDQTNNRVEIRDNGNYAKKDFSNVLATDLDNKFRATAAYKEIAQREQQLHDDIQKEFETNYYEETAAVDIATLDGEKIIIRYQVNGSNTDIQQQLPPASNGKTILMYLYYGEGITNVNLKIVPPDNESINGSPNILTFTQNSLVGLFIPVNNKNAWEFVQASEIHGNTSKNDINKGFLAYFDRGFKIPPITDDVRTTLISPNRIFMKDDSVTYNENIKSYTLIPELNGTMSEFKICMRVDLKSPLVADAGVSLYAQVLPSYDYLKDYNGNVVYVHKDIGQDSLYEYIEILTVVKVDQPTEIQFILLDRVTDTAMEVLDFNKGNTILAIERVTDNSELSLAITSFEQMTMQSLRMVKKLYSGVLDDFTGTKGITKPEKDVTAGSSFNYGNWTINFLDDAKLQIDNGNVIMTAGAVEMFTSLQCVLDSETTMNLVGKTLQANFVLKNQANSYKLSMAYWTRERDKYDYKIISSIDNNNNNTITLMDGWTLASEELMIPEPDDTSIPSNYTKDFVVPDEAVNIAFILRPVLDSMTNAVTVISANISISAPYARWQITSPQQANEQEVRQNPDLYKFQCHGKVINDSDEYYEIPGPATQIAVGEKVSGGNDIEIVRPSGNTYGDLHWFGKIKFKKDGFASITYAEIAGQGLLPQGVDTVDLEFWWAKDIDGTIANAQKIDSSSIVRTIHRGAPNDWESGGKTVHLFWKKFGMEVNANNTFFILGKSNHASPNAAVAFYEGYFNIDYSEDKFVKIQLERTINDLDIIKNSYRVTQAAIDGHVYANLDYAGSPSKPVLFAAQDQPEP